MYISRRSGRQQRQKSRFGAFFGGNGSLTSKCNFASELFYGEKQ